MLHKLDDQWRVSIIIWCKRYFGKKNLNDLVEDDSERDLWLRLFQSHNTFNIEFNIKSRWCNVSKPTSRCSVSKGFYFKLPYNATSVTNKVNYSDVVIYRILLFFHIVSCTYIDIVDSLIFAYTRNTYRATDWRI